MSKNCVDCVYFDFHDYLGNNDYLCFWFIGKCDRVALSNFICFIVANDIVCGKFTSLTELMNK